MKPHRGALILVLGILGLVMCFPLGIAAWIMGNGDLREIDQGTMDPSSRGLTQAGKIIGIVATVLGSLGFVIAIAVFGLSLLGAAAGALH